VADATPVTTAYSIFKWLRDVATATVIQRALEAYVTAGRYQVYLRRACQIYR